MYAEAQASIIGRVTLNLQYRQPVTTEEAFQPTEAQLIQQAKELAEDAWAELYHRYFPRIFGYFVRRVGEPALAEDLAAEVFVSAVKGIGRYQSRGVPVSAWLFRIAHNLLVDHIRRESRRGDLERESLDPGGESWEKAFELGLLRGELQEAMTPLTQEQRQVVLLRFIDGLSTREAAQILGKAEGAIKSLQHRALAAMRGTLERRWHE